MLRKNILGLMSGVAFTLISANVLAADRDDASILQDAKTKISAITTVATTSAPYIVVDVTAGKVKLSGMVNTKQQKKDAEVTAKAIEGVKDVDSEIIVKED